MIPKTIIPYVFTLNIVAHTNGSIVKRGPLSFLPVPGLPTVV